MRPSESAINAIERSVAGLDPNVQVWLFGSRADDAKRDGDIDLLVISYRLKFADRLRIKAKLSEHMEEQKADIIFVEDAAKAFARVALESGIRL